VNNSFSLNIFKLKDRNILGVGQNIPVDYGTSYGTQYVDKGQQYNPETIQENKQNLEKVSVYLNHPGAQLPKRKRYSNQIKGVFDHNMEWEQDSEYSMRKQNPRAKKTNLNLGYMNSKPEDFYKTSNQKYYSNKKKPQNRSEYGQLPNFKDKNSKDHLVFGTDKTNYKTESNTNYMDYDIASTLTGNQALPVKNKPGYNPLSFGTKNQYQSTYNTNYQDTPNEDSLNTFVNNYSKRQNNQESNILMNKGSSNFMSSYNADYKMNPRVNQEEDYIDYRTQKVKQNSRAYRNIIAFQDNKPKNNNFSKLKNQLRENTPFATSYNGDFQKYDLISSKKHFPNLQKTNFVLGDYSQNYLTCNKENYQGKSNEQPIMYAGKSSKINQDNIKNIMGSHGQVGRSDYDVFINEGKNKIKYI
jgi:hypothetical protein